MKPKVIRSTSQPAISPRKGQMQIEQAPTYQPPMALSSLRAADFFRQIGAAARAFTAPAREGRAQS